VACRGGAGRAVWAKAIEDKRDKNLEFGKWGAGRGEMADLNDAGPSHDRKGMVASEYETVFVKP
jgi:hypothetical protein